MLACEFFLKIGFCFEVWWSVFLEGREAFPCYRAKICEFEEKRKFFFESLEEGSHVWFSRLEEAVLEGILKKGFPGVSRDGFSFHGLWAMVMSREKSERDFGTV